MELVYGSKEEHLGTLRRAKSNGITGVWSGDIRRNSYLRENLNFGEAEGIIKTEFTEDYEAQESGFKITWLKSEF